MSVLTDEQLVEVIQAGVPGWLKKAKKNTKTLQVHVNGVGVAEQRQYFMGYRQLHINLQRAAEMAAAQ